MGGPPAEFQTLTSPRQADLDPVHDIVSDLLAREATTDGVIDAKKLKIWQEKHGPALPPCPTRSARSSLAARPTPPRALAEGAAARREALVAHSKLQVGKEFDKQLAQGSPEAKAMRADPRSRALRAQPVRRPCRTPSAACLSARTLSKPCSGWRRGRGKHGGPRRPETRGSQSHHREGHQHDRGGHDRVRRFEALERRRR